ncbi:arachidonate 15-lipoxygenase [Silurus meridionalis]|nr:arachidonate 15-lipoxygenase [Silurus meridionalis]
MQTRYPEHQNARNSAFIELVKLTVDYLILTWLNYSLTDRGIMEYKVIVATGNLEYSGTSNYVYLTLVGENGESERTLLDKPGLDLYRNTADEYLVQSSVSLGRVLLVRLEKQKYFVEDNWFCDYVKVTSPGGEVTQTFPCYCWLVGNIKVEVRDGKEYTMEHWKEDWFFGHQFMNGPNPRMIQRCRTLPSNFPVSGDMVQAFLSSKTTLDKELKAGNIYLVDYAVMDGLPGNVIRGKKQYIAAPLCLLYEHPDNGLIPIAIQLEQNPTEDTPMFLPNDPPLAWLLAKMWVRHAEFQSFEILSHLLRTHLIVEVFCVATLRHLPSVHPIYKLLTPHFKYTLEINCRARTQLISNNGIFKWVASTGGDGLLVLAQREYKLLTYRSLQPHYDFIDRGVTKLNKYFYREHSLMLWDAIEKFVSGIVSLYYDNDSEVVQDSELQAWIKEVVQEGFENVPHFGLSNELKNKQELITLLSVVIFTSTAQHAATNNGQFDFCSWVPNTPCTMRQPPPTDKDSVTMDLIMNTLPDISQSCMEMAITWHLGRPQPDAIPLAQYQEKYFTEPAAQKILENFRQDLKGIEEEIQKKTKGFQPPYHYLCPRNIENSITI